MYSDFSDFTIIDKVLRYVKIVIITYDMMLDVNTLNIFTFSYYVSDRDGVTDSLKILLMSILKPITQGNCKVYKNDQDNSLEPGFSSKTMHTSV